MRRAVPVVLVALAVPATSCQPAARALGGTAGEARLHADRLMRSLAGRFGPVVRGPEFVARRTRLARSALLPSRAFADSSLWTSREDSLRRLEFDGGWRAGRYAIEVRAGVPPPALPGDYRATLQLNSLGSGEYEWVARDELAVGPVEVGHLDRALTALFVAAERTGAGEARIRGGAELPRAALAAGRLFTLETLEIAPAAGGGVTLRLVVAMRPEGIEATFPRYARYLRKYASPTRFHAELLDDQGGQWWEAEGREDRLTLRLRVRDGSLAPLTGPPRRVPGRLFLRGDLSARMGPFRVGLRGLEAEIALTRTPSEKAFTARFRKQPDWELPFLVAPLLRSSLRRPFTGEGALLSLAARGQPGATVLVRDYRVAVKESWIVRWLGRLAGSAMSEFWRGAEEEADTFNGQVIDALRADLLALVPESGP